MNLKEIKEYFDSFCKNNEIISAPYSFYYFYLDVYESKNKKLKIYKNENSIFISYNINGKNKYPYLPIVKYNVFENKFDYINLCKDYFNNLIDDSIKIIYVPFKFYDFIESSFNISKYDIEYIYNTNDFLTLKDKKKVRYYYNYCKNHYNPKFRVMDEKDKNNVYNLLETWKNNAKERYFRIYDTIKNKNWLNNFNIKVVDQYNYVVYSNNVLISVIGFYKPYPETNNVHCFILKSDLNYIGSSIYTFVESMKYLNRNNIDKMNFMGSIGFKSLDNFKRRLHPNMNINIYNIIFTPTKSTGKLKNKSVLF